MAKQNISYQIIRALDQGRALGESRHSGKHTGECMSKIYSLGEYESLKSFAKTFQSYLRESDIRIRYVKDITTKQWQDFLDAKAHVCGYATLKNYISRIHKIEVLCQTKYGFEKKWAANLMVPQSKVGSHEDMKRVQTMDSKDLERIRSFGENYSNSKAVIAIELAARYGLRVSEISALRLESVNLTDMKLRVCGKGGKTRYLEIKEEDREFFQKICDNKQPRQNLVGIRPDSINQYLNRTMTKLGIKDKYPLTGVHAIRKLVAQNMWYRLRDSGLSKQETMNRISVYLGHGEGRYDVLNAYVKDQS